jgi:serine/threonine-protein kinase RsbT
MDTLRTKTITIESIEDIVIARRTAREWSAELGFSLVDQTKLVTAVSELARNTLIHGGGGTATLQVITEKGRRGLRLAFEDKGPGIPDIEMAMTDGYSKGDGLGHGLGGASRLVKDFEIESRVGEGTRVSITKWKEKARSL